MTSPDSKNPRLQISNSTLLLLNFSTTKRKQVCAKHKSTEQHTESDTKGHNATRRRSRRKASDSTLAPLPHRPLSASPSVAPLRPEELAVTAAKPRSATPGARSRNYRHFPAKLPAGPKTESWLSRSRRASSQRDRRRAKNKRTRWRRRQEGKRSRQT